jgi:signal transduction histidine kinase
LGQFIAAIILLVCSAAPAAGVDESKSSWNVMILDSTDPSAPGAQSVHQAIRQVLTTQASHPIDFYSEFLDSVRFQGPSYESEFVAFLTQKYRGHKPDLVVTVLPGALEFLGRHRTDLWPDTPAVFFGVPDDLASARTTAPGVTGVLQHVDFAGTLELALRLQPGTRRVVVVSGASDFDRLWRVRAEMALRAYAGRVESSYLDGLAIPELLETVAHLPPGTIVLHTTVLLDGEGHRTKPREVTAQVAGASSVPVYGTFEPALGTGIIGASIVGVESQAHRAGELALRILQGKRPESMPVEPSAASVPTVDWRQMRRFGLSESLLPPGTLVLFRPTPIWEQYWGEIVGGLAVFVLQFSLIVTLLIERRQRRRAERRSRDLTVELAHASRLTTVGEITASIAHQVNQPLAAILSNAEAAELLLDASPLPLGELRQILADIRRDDERAGEVIHGMRALLQRREVEVRPVDLNEATSEILRLLNGESSRLGVTVEVDLLEGLPAVAGDRVHLQQVVLNLVMNGLEATAERCGGGNRVTVRTKWRETGEVEVAVEDTGPGIAPEHFPRLFDSFFTTKKNGMGLGLSIARSLVESHGGRIWAENNTGGATFRFVLPGCARSSRDAGEPLTVAAASRAATSDQRP